MKKDLKIGTSPLTGKIYVGHITNNGLWSKDKTEVTEDAILAVFQHMLKEGNTAIKFMNNETGKVDYKLSIESFVEEQSND